MVALVLSGVALCPLPLRCAWVTHILVGHRGAVTQAPDNCMASSLLAERSGATEAELDLRITHDGAPIVLHHGALARVAGEPGPLTDTPVREVLDATSVELQVEIKDSGSVPALAELVLSWPADAARIRFTSVQTEALMALREHAPSVPRGLIVNRGADAQQHGGGLDGTLEAVGASTFTVVSRASLPARWSNCTRLATRFTSGHCGR